VLIRERYSCKDHAYYTHEIAGPPKSQARSGQMHVVPEGVVLSRSGQIYSIVQHSPTARCADISPNTHRAAKPNLWASIFPWSHQSSVSKLHSLISHLMNVLGIVQAAAHMHVGCWAAVLPLR
jgi:hypothetical protein